MILAIRREPSGGYAVVVDALSARHLLGLPRRLHAVLSRPGTAKDIIARLFPKAYDDPSEEAEYRRLLGNDLMKRKLRDVAAFEATLRRRKRVRCEGEKAVELSLTAEEYDVWLGFVNDMRLVLGCELDIRDEGWSEELDPTHPKAADFALLHYLSWLEEELLRAHPGMP